MMMEVGKEDVRCFTVIGVTEPRAKANTVFGQTGLGRETMER